MHPKSHTVPPTNPNHIHNPHDMTKLDLNNSNTKPKSKFGFQEIVILVLIILIVVLAVVAAIIFLRISPFSNSSSTTSSKSSTTTYVSSSVTSTSKTSSASTSISSTVSTSLSTTSKTSASSTTVSSSSSSSSKSSTSSTVSSTSASTSSSTTSVAGNLKVYFSKGDGIDVVGRDSTATTTYQKTIDAVLAKVKGPTAAEISAGFKADLNLSGDSNCAGNWFELDTSGGKATLKFCRTVTLTGAVADGLLEQSLGKTLMDNSGLSKVVILNRDNNCLFNASGLNSCKN